MYQVDHVCVELLLILLFHENTVNSLREEDVTNESKTMTQPVKQSIKHYGVPSK